MAKKTQNLKPDTVLKNYWSDNGQFADFFNAALFDGEQVIFPDELEDIDTEESFILEHRDYAESIKASRDNIKICKKSTAYAVELVILGVESQEHIHYAMPMRVMGYDYGAYKKQYDSNAKKYQTADGLDENEYLSKMKKTDRFTPVITAVLYYGSKPWDGATTLYGMLNIPDRMKQFVNDYKMLLIEARQNSLVFHNMNNVAFFEMMKIILDKSLETNEAKKKVIEYATENNVDKTVVMTVAGATNRMIDYNALSKKGDGNMYNLFDEIEKEGKAEGKAEGIIETGLDCGLSEDEIIQRLQNKLSLSLQKAQEYFEMFGKQTV